WNLLHVETRPVVNHGVTATIRLIAVPVESVLKPFLVPAQPHHVPEVAIFVSVVNRPIRKHQTMKEPGFVMLVVREHRTRNHVASLKACSGRPVPKLPPVIGEIGRASCRETQVAAG